MRSWRVDTLVGVIALAVAAAFAWEAAKLPLGTLHSPGAAFFPLALAGLLAAAGLLLLVAAPAAQRLREIAWPEVGHAASIITVCAFASLALERLGYRLTVAAMLVALVAGVERKPLVLALAIAAALSAASYWVFATLLRVPLPTGPWGI